MMNKKNILAVILSLITIVLLFNIFIITPEAKLSKDANKIKKRIDSLNKAGISDQILINNEYKIDNKVYKVNGEGVIFLEDNYSFFLERENLCAIKLPYEEEVMIQKESCPKYRMFSGIKFQVVKTGTGLYSINDYYIFKGKGSNNHVLLDNTMYRILEFNEKEMKLLTTDIFAKNKEIINNDKYLETYLDDSFIDNQKKYFIKTIDNNYKNVGGSGTKNDPFIILEN